MNLTLVRVSENEDSTFGVLVDSKGTAFAVTVELPWRDNKKSVSRIPAGTYEIARMFSPSFKIETFYILGVPGRKGVMFHPANLAVELEGCVGVGHGFDPAAPKGRDTDDGIVQSVKEWKELMQRMRGVSKATLVVIDPPRNPWVS